MAILTATSLLAGGCALEPRQTNTERHRLAEAGRVYETPLDKRPLSDLELGVQPTWREVLRRAFYANGDVEAAYFEWKAAVQRIRMESAYPNSNVQVGFDYMFSDESMKAWDRTTLSAGFDPAMMLQWPGKTKKAGEIALAEARARGARFAAVKFALQRQVLTAYLDYALTAERVRIQTQNVELVKLILDTAAQRVRAGAAQQDLLKAQTEYEMARNELAAMQSELRGMRAMLNGMLARPADAPLEAPVQLPEPRTLAADDAALIAVAVDANPDLQGLAHEVAGREDALELARMAYIPDISPQFSMTGSVSQAVGAMVSLPTNLIRIRGSIEEAKAMLRASEAMARQTRSDRAAAFVAALIALRDSERQEKLFAQTIVPKAQQVLDSSRRAYSVGSLGFVELIDSQRTLLDARLLVAEARTAREKRLAELEALAGVDIETLGAPTPSTVPSEPPPSLSQLPHDHPATLPDERGGSTR